MKTFLSTLAITLAITFTAAPADALDDLAKCRVYNAKIKMNYAKCLELDKLLVEKGKEPKGTCESKRTASLEKANAKFVTKLGVNADDCRIDLAPATADRLQQLFGAGVELTESQLNTLSTYNANGNQIAARAEQTGCEAANGTWDGSVCTPAAVPDRDCFREGACGVNGWNYGPYAGVTVSSTGCEDTSAGTFSYMDGELYRSVYPQSDESNSVWVAIRARVCT
jgi:hypothetical protein